MSNRILFNYYAKKYKRAKRKIRDIPNINLVDKYIFIHIPKNGGTSLYEALGMSRSTHHYYRDYQRLIGGSAINDFFRFSFVRNPWARFVSLYDYARKTISYHHNSIDPGSARYGKHQDYELLKDATLEQCCEYLLDGRLVHGSPYIQWNNQNKWLKDADGNIRLSFLGRIENFNADCKMLEYFLQKEISLKHLNSSNIGHYKERLSPRCISIINRYYEEDIELFKYKY